MKSNEFRKIQVEITTYKKDNLIDRLKNMSEDKNRRNYKTHLNNKFICSICLSSKQEGKDSENNKINSKSCPICQRSCDICMEKAPNKSEKVHDETLKAHKTINVENKEESKKTETKSVQTMQNDFNKNLNLLNEVLTVFQSKKIDQARSKTVILKDASVSTNLRTLNSKLSVSKVFQFSVDQNGRTENGKFIVMSSKTDCKRSNIDLIKNKSSSIPQMKMEKLEHSLKEKTKPKDAIEEVNRIFATVRKNYNSDGLNRPSIRSGPRILPVVETVLDHNKKLLFENETKFNKKHSYKYCQTSCMSSGDSIKCCHDNESERYDRTQCFHQKESEKCDKTPRWHSKDSERCDKAQCCHSKESGRCEKCVYMLCCHYKNCRQMQAGVMICERCRDVKEMRGRLSERSFEDSG